MKDLVIKIEQDFFAAEHLFSEKLYRQSIFVLWNAIRSVVFYHLKTKSINYTTTEEAVKEFVKINEDNRKSEDVIFFKTVGVLCEWDEYFVISSEQAIEYKKMATDFVKDFVCLPDTDKRLPYYNVLENEINRHLIDSQCSQAIHYAAADRNEKWYTFLLWTGFVVSLIGLSALLYTVTYDSNLGIKAGQFIALLGAGLTIWPLIKDYSGRAVTHRRFAEEYNRIVKMSKNWKTDFPDDSALVEAKIYVQTIRYELIIINSLSPVTKNIDYVRGQQNIEKGSYKY